MSKQLKEYFKERKLFHNYFPIELCFKWQFCVQSWLMTSTPVNKSRNVKQSCEVSSLFLEKPRNKQFQIFFKFWLCPCFLMSGLCFVFLLFSRKVWYNSCQLPMSEILPLNWQCCREIRQCFEHARLERFLSSNPLEIHSFPSARY